MITVLIRIELIMAQCDAMTIYMAQNDAMTIYVLTLWQIEHLSMATVQFYSGNGQSDQSGRL